MKKRYVDANRLRKMKKLKITEKLSERQLAEPGRSLLLWRPSLCAFQPSSPVLSAFGVSSLGLARSGRRLLSGSGSAEPPESGVYFGPSVCLQKGGKSAAAQLNVGLLLTRLHLLLHRSITSSFFTPFVLMLEIFTESYIRIRNTSSVCLLKASPESVQTVQTRNDALARIHFFFFFHISSLVVIIEKAPYIINKIGAYMGCVSRQI